MLNARLHIRYILLVTLCYSFSRLAFAEHVPSGTGRAAPPAVYVPDRGYVNSDIDRGIVVVHVDPEYQYTSDNPGIAAANALIEQFRKNKRPVVYISASSRPYSPLLREKPDERVLSHFGSFSLAQKEYTDVTIIGGFHRKCTSEAIRSIEGERLAGEGKMRTLNLHFPLEGQILNVGQTLWDYLKQVCGTDAKCLEAILLKNAESPRIVSNHKVYLDGKLIDQTDETSGIFNRHLNYYYWSPGKFSAK